MGARRPESRAIRSLATYARYPRYPQADSAWTDSDSMTASGCGRDDLPATGESLPSHSPGGCLIPSSDWRSAEADGRAADEAAAMRTMAGLPFSGCESGRLREAPIRNRPSFGNVGDGSGPETFGPSDRIRPDTGSSDPGPARQKAVSSDRRAATGSEGASAPEGSGRTGLRPGSCERAWTQGFGSWPCQAEPEASAEDPAGRALRCFGS